MERVDGPDLRARLTKDGALPWPEVEGLARRLLDALGAAHERGFVHRDVKPGNILLAPDGAKLCDFGIARLDGATTLTQSAALIGSLRYMAPEQQRLGRAVAQSDLYSLGLVLHEALAGGLPGEKPLPSGVPRHLRRLLERLLSERIEGRPDSAAAALRLLERRVPVGVLTVGTSAALALAVFLLMPDRSPVPEPAPVLQEAAVTQEAPAAPEAQAPVQQATPEPPVPTQAIEVQQAKQTAPPPSTPSRRGVLPKRGRGGEGLGSLAAPREEEPEQPPASKTRELLKSLRGLDTDSPEKRERLQEEHRRKATMR
jgi:serine/threonine-protein kinase